MCVERRKKHDKTPIELRGENVFSSFPKVDVIESERLALSLRLSCNTHTHVHDALIVFHAGESDSLFASSLTFCSLSHLVQCVRMLFAVSMAIADADSFLSVPATRTCT